METHASTLIHFVQKHYLGYNVECCYESCCLGYHIYRDLTRACWNVLVVNPGDIPRINKQNSSKTDKIDSRYLCNQLASGHLRGIYVADEKQEQFRSLFRRRSDLVKNLRRIKCHIKSMLLYYGIVLPKEYDNNNWSKAMIAWIETLEWLYRSAAITMQSRINEYAFLQKEYSSICTELRGYARTSNKKDYYLLRSIPGVGPFIAIGMLSEIGDLRRFKGIDHLSSYIGLVPSLHSSGGKTYTKGITSRSKRLLRSYLVEGAWITAKKDPELMQYYQDRKGSDHKS
jgi:transposase